MAGRGLFSRLETGQGQAARTSDVIGSIVEHLRVLLNTREGESASAPKFGVVDFNDIVHVYPEAARRLEAAIRTAIQEYEPRLKNVSVHHKPEDGDVSTLSFEITARLAQGEPRGLLRFRTQMESGGKFQVR